MIINIYKTIINYINSIKNNFNQLYKFKFFIKYLINANKFNKLNIMHKILNKIENNIKYTNNLTINEYKCYKKIYLIKLINDKNINININNLNNFKYNFKNELKF